MAKKLYKVQKSRKQPGKWAVVRIDSGAEMYAYNDKGEAEKDAKTRNAKA